MQNQNNIKDNVFSEANESYYINVMYGTYADALFILLPFLILTIQRAVNGEGVELLKHADLSIASSIFAGMSIGKFVLGLISEKRLARYKEKIVFFIAVTLFFVLAPSLMIIVAIASPDEAPDFVVFVQPVILIIAISLYSSAVSISNWLTQTETDEEADPERVRQVELANEAESKIEPLEIPARTENTQ